MSESSKSGAHCPLCRCDYDLYLRTPRVVPKCGHTFCEKCINARLVTKATRKVFPCCDCGAEAVIRKSVADDLPKNISILDIVKNLKKFASNDRQEERKPYGSQTCQQHMRPLELVCQTCNSMKICSHCALFGDHKAHSFAKEMPASKVDLKDLKEIFEIITDSVRETLLPQAQGSIKATTKQQVKEGLSKHISACFKQYYDMIRRKEQDLLQEIDNIVINEGGIDANIDKLIKEYDQLKNKYDYEWRAAVDGEPTKRILTFDQTDQYINRCKDLHTNVENLLAHAHQHIDKVISDIGLRIMQTPMFKIQQMPFSLKRTVENFNQQQQQQEVASPEKKARLKSVTSESKSKSVVDKEEIKVNNYLQDRNANRSQNKVAPPKKSRDSYSHIEKSDQQEDFSLLDAGKSDLSFFKEQPQKELKELPTNKCLPNQNRGSLPPKAVRPKIAANITETFDSKTVSLKNQKEQEKQKHSIKDISPAKTMGVISKSKPVQSNQIPLQQPTSSHCLAEQLKFVRPTKQISFQFLSRFQELMVQTDRQSSLNCLELVGADINDTLLLYVLDYLRMKKYRFQIIKLVKNVITDQGFKLLLSALVNDNTTQVLNLTSNQLSPRSLELILLFARHNNILRTIYLTNNKISSFNLKAKKNELQAYELEIII